MINGFHKGSIMNHTPDYIKRYGLTFEEWLSSRTLPDGFREYAYGHWDQHSPIDWALHCFSKRKNKRYCCGISSTY